MTTPQEPQFYAQLRGTIVRNGPRIACIEVRVGAREDGAGGNAIHTIEDLKDREPDEIMSEIKEAIDADSAHWPGMVRYQVAAVDRDGSYLGGRMIVEKRGRGRADAFGDEAPDEEATGKGITSQHMRFTESMFRTSTQHSQVMLELLGRALVASNERETRLMSDHFRMVEMGEQFLDRKAERDLWVSREKDKDSLRAKAFDALFKFAPVLAGHMAQGTRFEEPAKQLAQGSAMSQLGESFKKEPERFEKILSCFSAEEKLGIMTGDFAPVLLAMDRAAKVMKGEGSEEDMATAMRLKPLQDLLKHEEKVVLMQLAEGSKKAPEPEKPVKADIEVKQIDDPKIVSIDSKKRGA